MATITLNYDGRSVKAKRALNSFLSNGYFTEINPPKQRKFTDAEFVAYNSQHFLEKYLSKNE